MEGKEGIDLCNYPQWFALVFLSVFFSNVSFLPQFNCVMANISSTVRTFFSMSSVLWCWLYLYGTTKIRTGSSIGQGCSGNRSIGLTLSADDDDPIGLLFSDFLKPLLSDSLKNRKMLTASAQRAPTPSNQDGLTSKLKIPDFLLQSHLAAFCLSPYGPGLVASPCKKSMNRSRSTTWVFNWHTSCSLTLIGLLSLSIALSTTFLISSFLKTIISRSTSQTAKEIA